LTTGGNQPRSLKKMPYKPEEVIIERTVNRLYGMAIARARNKAMLDEAKTAFDLIIQMLYAQWNGMYDDNRTDEST
jgi:hypothetical protein